MFKRKFNGKVDQINPFINSSEPRVQNLLFTLSFLFLHAESNMKILRAKIKKTSPYYTMGLNQKGKSVWLSITGFNPMGERNYRINAIKDIKGGFAEYQEIWISKEDLTLKQIEDGQLSLELYSAEEFEIQKRNPKHYNKRRFEVITKNEKQYLYAPDIEGAQAMAKQLGLHDFKIRQVKRLSRKDIEE